jgi:DNA-binding transcriptional ArsR family regulator
LKINAIVEHHHETTLDATLGALADPTRRRVVDLLQSDPQPAGVIAAHLGMSPAATSRHLRVLRSSGLVEVETPSGDARLRVYRLRVDQLGALRAWLDQVEAHWAEQLGAFKDHVDQHPSGSDRTT